MNEKIIGWFEDLIPEIKKSGNVKEVFLKFATDKNLAPALLEKLGQVYNTAKTVNYLDKTASDKRGATFKILDVADLLDSYVKSSNNGYTEADTKNLSSGRVPRDLFGGMVKDIPMESSFNEQEIKLASDLRSKFKKESSNARNKETLDQFIFDTKEDIRELCDQFTDEIQKRAASFEKTESDARYYFEGAANEACEKLAKYLESKHIHVKRASEDNKHRIVEDYKALNLVGQLQNKLNDLNISKSAAFEADVIQEFTEHEKQAFAGAKKRRYSSQTTGQESEEETSSGGGGKKNAPNKGGLSAVDLVKTPYEATGQAAGAIGAGSSKLRAMAERAVTGADSANPDQAAYDLNSRDMEHAAILQNLITTDEILSEEDPEKVVAAYNSFRKLAPELANDINIARVTLRSMIQHEGLSVFDANQFSKAELDSAKVDNAGIMKEKLLYGDREERNNALKKI